MIITRDASDTVLPVILQILYIRIGDIFVPIHLELARYPNTTDPNLTKIL